MLALKTITLEQVEEVIKLLQQVELDPTEIYALASWESEDLTVEKFMGLKDGMFVVSLITGPEDQEQVQIQEFADLVAAITTFNC